LESHGGRCTVQSQAESCRNTKTSVSEKDIISSDTGVLRRYSIAKKHFTAKEAKQVGEKLGIDWKKWDVEQFRMGMDVELEHGTVDPHTNVTNDDPIMTGKIALAHLNEIPDYYTRLDKMEREAEGKD
jgi:hypothetical protein